MFLYPASAVLILKYFINFVAILLILSLRLGNSSSNSDKQSNEQTKNPSVLIYKIYLFFLINIGIDLSIK